MKARPILIAVVILLVAGLGTVIAYAISQRPLLELGVGYGARVACGCRHIGGRSLEDCRKDFEPGMEAIRLSEDKASRSVTASVPLIASRTARFDPVLGCVPEPYTGR